MAVEVGAPALRDGVRVLAARLVENGAGTYEAQFRLPAFAILQDIIVEAEALWAAATSASLEVGDAADPDGFFTAIDLKAVDLLAGESVNFSQTGGLQGAYVGQVAATAATDAAGWDTHVKQRRSATERVITAKATSVGAGTTGRTRVTVLYIDPSPVNVGKNA